MQIRYGFDIALELAQPATILAMMDVHSDSRHRIAKETDLRLFPVVAADRFTDGRGNMVRRLSAPAGYVSLRLDGVFAATVGKMRPTWPPNSSRRLIGLDPRLGHAESLSNRSRLS